MSFADRSVALRVLLATSLLAPFAGLVARGATVTAVLDHLVLSEVVTGGASASDELIEVYNPTPAELPLEGLELVYVSASGATVTRRAAWAVDDPPLQPGRHLLVANEAGIFAPIADFTYTGGMAAGGGSVALRIQGATAAIDAIGWGTAVSSWLEAPTAAAPAVGASIERLPGGSLGSTIDTDDNAADFVERPVPDPQNLGSPPAPDPGATLPTPTPLPTPPAPTPPTTPVATPPTTPDAPVIPIAEARAAANGTRVTVEGVTLTDAAFHDGGGFLADGSGGIAVLVTGGSFPRGRILRVSGEVDDRFAQRTIRAEAADVTEIGPGSEAPAMLIATGEVGEAAEGELVRISAELLGSPTTLAGGLAFDVDDGTGPTRVVVGTTTGIDTDGWVGGAGVELVGVVGQRDSSGSGSAGYRVMPRGAADVVGLTPAASPAPTPHPSTASQSDGASPTPASGPSVSVAVARAAAPNSDLTVRGVVTLPPGVVDDTTAAIQDSTGGIVLRVGEEAGGLAIGSMVEVTGARSTKSGMATLRVAEDPRQLGRGTMPEARLVRTGDADEPHEATLIVVRGALVASARRSSTGSVSLNVDDGSGALKVVLGASLRADVEPLVEGTWVEVTGVLGQVTTGAEPLAGYRLWPSNGDGVRIVARPTAAGAGAETDPEVDPSLDGLGGLGHDALAALRVRATLVSGPWPELRIGGLLWDGDRLVAIDAASGALLAPLLAGRRPPLVVELSGLATVAPGGLDVPTVALGRGADAVAGGGGAPVSPLVLRGGAATPAWVALVGLVSGPAGDRSAELKGGAVRLEDRCDDGEPIPNGRMGITGIAIGTPGRILVGCDGILPAPVLSRAATRGAAAENATSAAQPDETVVADVGRLAAAALLAAAGSVLAAAGIGRWRQQRQGDAPVEDPLASAGDEDADRSLTLIRLPPEHGS